MLALAMLAHMSTAQGEYLVPEWTIGDRLRKAREAANLKQQEIADELGIARKSVSNYEQSITVPRKPVLLSWSIRTGVPVEWLLTGTLPPPGPTQPGRARRDSNPQPSDPKSHVSRRRRVVPMIVPAA